jgi:hypothetical protein
VHLGPIIIAVIDAIVIPVFLPNILNLPDSIKICPRIEDRSICRANAQNLTGIVTRTCATATADENVGVIVAGTVGLARMKITVDVNVGDGVNVFAGVWVGNCVAVDVGMAAAVWVRAAFAVCAMNTLIWLGSTVATGAPTEGTHAATIASAENQNK